MDSCPKEGMGIDATTWLSAFQSRESRPVSGFDSIGWTLALSMDWTLKLNPSPLSHDIVRLVEQSSEVRINGDDVRRSNGMARYVFVSANVTSAITIEQRRKVAAASIGMKRHTIGRFIHIRKDREEALFSSSIGIGARGSGKEHEFIAIVRLFRVSSTSREALTMFSSRSACSAAGLEPETANCLIYSALMILLSSQSLGYSGTPLGIIMLDRLRVGGSRSRLPPRFARDAGWMCA